MCVMVADEFSLSLSTHFLKKKENKYYMNNSRQSLPLFVNIETLGLLIEWWWWWWWWWCD
jgi:hypothetical protein